MFINSISSGDSLYLPYSGSVENPYNKKGGEVPPDVEEAVVRYKKAYPDIDLQGLQNLIYNQKGVKLDKGEIERILRRRGFLDGELGGVGVQEDTKNVFKIEGEECSACEKRRYQCSEGSITYMSAPESLIRVPQHEMEHVAKARQEAIREGKEVVYTDINVEYAICPECGKRYATSGRATVKTQEKPEYPQEEIEVKLPTLQPKELRDEPPLLAKRIANPIPPLERVNLSLPEENGPKESPPTNESLNPYAGRYSLLNTSYMDPTNNINILG